MTEISLSRSRPARYPRYAAVAALFLSLAFCPAFGLDPRLARFLPATSPATPTPVLSVPAIPAFSPQSVSVEAHNQGVDLNNQGLDRLRDNEVAQAIKLLYQATESDPTEKGFWNNLLVALKRDPRRGQEALAVSYKLIALEPKSAKGYQAAGSVL
ncbi:MAG TPA: hypothetical protein PKO06_21625, partial [Candidatus Ozemobacteraceae bacterium]|nr:hypothetical protein [Candidatus Ozemobacteraceae bacterium]